jgi:multiple sugar transport system substrate-binding protein
MPLAERWAAWTFLARAAPSVCNRGKLSTVFDRENIEPLINLPPFVEALEQLKSIASARSYELDPAGVFRLMQGGGSAIAISWPSIAFDPSLGKPIEEEVSGELTTEKLNPQQSLGDFSVYPLPGALRWYDQKSKRWIVRKKSDEKRVGLIGFSGLVASVAKGSFNEQTAWGFLKWLPDKAISKVTMAESAISGPFRASHLGEMMRWTGDWVPQTAAFEYADVIELNHQRGVVLMFPRIPQASRYLEVLDLAVRQVVAGGADAQAALDEVARQWNEITDEIGRESQQKRLRKVTGI